MGCVEISSVGQKAGGTRSRRIKNLFQEMRIRLTGMLVAISTCMCCNELIIRKKIFNEIISVFLGVAMAYHLLCLH